MCIEWKTQRELKQEWERERESKYKYGKKTAIDKLNVSIYWCLLQFFSRFEIFQNKNLKTYTKVRNSL